MNLKKELSIFFEGDIEDEGAVLDTYSTDASVCKIRPLLVLYPKNSKDIAHLVHFVGEKKAEGENLSITPRGAGTDMSGAAIGTSIILDLSRYMQGILEWKGNTVRVLPGTFYRDFEKEAVKRDMLLPCFPASKNLCTLGGMVANNSAGEKTLVYGQTIQYVKQLKAVFADGREYEIKPLSRAELDAKISQNDFEGELYRKILSAVENNKDLISLSRPKTSKNAAGYYLWDVIREDGNFDMVKLLVGSQGTLGIITEITFELVPLGRESQMTAIYLKDLKRIPDVVALALPKKPSSIESFDDQTISLAVKYFPDIAKSRGFVEAVKLFFNFIPEFLMYFFYGFPKLVMIIEFEGKTKEEVFEKAKDVALEAKGKGLLAKVVRRKAEARKFWAVRRESYNLLRKHAAGKQIATFIEDVIVPPERLFEFLPKLNEILHSYDLTYSIAGHAGSGNFHVFPLMNFKDEKIADKIVEISGKVYDLVAACGGSITAEHNDGISRTPFLGKIFKPELLALFVEVKKIFDSQDIFNPHKKTDVSVEYFKSVIKRG